MNQRAPSATSAAPSAPADLAVAEAAVWQLLQRGARDRHAAARHPCLVTMDAAGLPQARTVVLRAVHPDLRELVFHSDRRSQKVAALRAHPACAVHVYDPRRRLQLRMDGDATVATEGPEVDAEWQRLSPSAREGYAVRRPPGSALAAPEDATDLGDEVWARRQFCRIRVRVRALEGLWLRPEGHRRAGFCYEPPQPPEWRVP